MTDYVLTGLVKRLVGRGVNNRVDARRSCQSRAWPFAGNKFGEGLLGPCHPDQVSGIFKRFGPLLLEFLSPSASAAEP